jgi:Zn-dependent protease with chaperone function
MSGLLLHDIASYDRGQRPRVSQVFGLGLGFGVRDVVPGSAAERADIREGDEIIAIGTRMVDDFALDQIRSEASPARVEAFEQTIGRSLQTGTAAFIVRRKGAIVKGTLLRDVGCGGTAVFASDDVLDAWSDGKRVAVTLGIVELARTDDELAFVIAHEMAHNILGHARQLRGRSDFLARLGIGSGAFQKSEREADGLAIALMEDAGYEPAAAATFLARLKTRQRGVRSLTHPALDSRINAIRQSVAAKATVVVPDGKSALPLAQ